MTAVGLVAGVMPPGVCVCEGPIEGISGALFDAEVALVERAVESRREEFRAGRVLGRRALTRLGLPECAIVRGGDRAPRWPEGVVGSITHTRRVPRGYVAVAVATCERSRGVGIDVEHRAPLDEPMARKVLTDEERVWLRSELDPGGLAKIVFSAKESFYKAQYALSGAYLGFQAASVCLDEARRAFVLTLLEAVADLPAGSEYPGRYALGDDLIATGVVIPALNQTPDP